MVTDLLFMHYVGKAYIIYIQEVGYQHKYEEKV